MLSQVAYNQELIRNNRIIFDSVYFDKTHNLYQITFLHNNVVYTYFCDIDIEEDIVEHVEHCRYLDEVDQGKEVFTFYNVSLTKLIDAEPLSNEKLLTFDCSEISKINEILTAYFSDFPEMFLRYIH